jgi:hypothetical protein
VSLQNNVDRLKKKASGHQLSEKEKKETEYPADSNGHHKHDECWARAGGTVRAVGRDSGRVPGDDNLGLGTGGSWSTAAKTEGMGSLTW